MNILDKGVHRFTDRQVGRILDGRRRSDEIISSAHNESNLRNTARLTQVVGRLYGFSPKEQRLAYVAGALHDIVRSSREGGPLTDEIDSAQIAVNMLRRPTGRLILPTSGEERAAVAYAIENHGTAPELFTNSLIRNKMPDSLQDKIHMALFVADKMTANGFDVMRRRPSFDDGERLHKADGDLQEYGFMPDRDEALVVAMESVIRLGFVNPESMYPERLQPLVGPLYETQREFVRGVMKGSNLHNKDIAELLLGRDPISGDERKRDGKSMAEIRKLSVPIDSDELAHLLAENTGITDASIDATPDGVADGALETLNYFSTNWETDLDELTRIWKPETPVAQEWQKGMLTLVA